MSSKKHSILFIVVAVAALLAFTSVAYAAHVTIDTNDGTVDTNWSSVPVLVTEPGDVANSNYDIASAWVGNDAASPSEVYFRVDLVGGPLPSLGDSLEARLDCSTPANGSFQDSEDMVVYYYLGVSEDVSECQGNLYASGCPFASIEQNGATFGEEIAGPPSTYEWKADISGTANWSACLDEINVQFASFNGTTEIDSTAWGQGGYSVPNVVTLKSLTAQNQLMPVAAIVLGVVVVGGLVVIRRRKGR